MLPMANEHDGHDEPYDPPQTAYGAFCDDWYMNVRLGSHLPLPRERSASLHFFEQVQKAFPDLRHFHAGPPAPGSRRPDLHLEGESAGEPGGSYRWVSVAQRHLSAGHVNPPSLAEASRLHRLMLEACPYALGVSPLEVESLDVLAGFDFEFAGDHEEVVASTMLADSPLASVLDHGGGRPAEVSPRVTVAFDDEPGLLARLEIVTRGGTLSRGGDADGGDAEVIRVFLTLRRLWSPPPREALEAVYRGLLARTDELLARQIVPNVLRPLAEAISARS